jgi:PAS domain-containing protein
MPQQPIEIILLRQWATHMAIPIWIAGMDGHLVFYNEPAEQLLGVRFEDAGEMHVEQLSDLFSVLDEYGNAIPPEDIPLSVALLQRKASHRALRYRALDGVWHDADITAFPIDGQGGLKLGAVALIWKKNGADR